MKANITMLILSVLALSANAQTDTLKAQQLEGVTISRQYIQQTADPTIVFPPQNSANIPIPGSNLYGT